MKNASAEVAIQMAAGESARKGASLRAFVSPDIAFTVSNAAAVAETPTAITRTAAHAAPTRPSHASPQKTRTIPGGCPCTCRE
ncbi:MAG: hypothetical protein GEU68_06205 [Actinobacteria bacterium]|nr:hypothetical protein [Actinomycetota bacterium]